MTDDIPEEDKQIQVDYLDYLAKAKCTHDYADFYGASGISKRNKNILNVPVFCKKCLDKKLLKIDVSDNDWCDPSDND